MGGSATARYFDGHSARPRDVTLVIGADTLDIVDAADLQTVHWPLRTLRALSARSDETVQLTPDTDSDERLVLSDAALIAALRKACPGLYQRPVRPRRLRRAILWTGAAAGSIALILLVLVPMLADQLSEFVPPEREQALGDAVAGQLSLLLADQDGDGPEICTERAGQRALDKMTARLSGNLDLPYELRVSVIDHGWVNALALPGGRVLIFRGLIDAAETPEEVAGVLAHEIGHVVHRDPTRGVLRAAGTAGIIGLLLGDFFGASIMAAASDHVLNARHQREAERLADEKAYALLTDAGLPTRPFAGFFRRLRAEHGDTRGVMKYVASHPGLGGRADRADAADRIGERRFSPVLADHEWLELSLICVKSIPVREPE